jgi:HTH-type transcriptional regulator/antitoxin HipB
MHLGQFDLNCIICSAMTLEAIGATIRDARKGLKLSQEALASRIGMSRATLSAIENGTVPEIGIRKVIALCNELGLILQVGKESERPTLQQLREERRATRTSR